MPSKGKCAFLPGCAALQNRRCQESLRWAEKLSEMAQLREDAKLRVEKLQFCEIGLSLRQLDCLLTAAQIAELHSRCCHRGFASNCCLLQQCITLSEPGARESLKLP